MNRATGTRLRKTAAGVLAIVTAGLVGAGCGDRPATVTVLRGTVDVVDASGTTVGFEGRRVAGPRLRIVDENGPWVIAGASWSDGRSWHDGGTPAACLDPGPKHVEPVELGVVEAERHEDAPGRGVVVWVRCLNPR